eukprot:comp19870_c1_seq1/m.24019 comp19870_c1_seq1/g.24019  ORF comp19870_c1_seq1/g.24019 comp19870_c1_seq1/m.24019 type:complete len:166 (-) comp19870_c1_seq1:87-584(-)
MQRSNSLTMQRSNSFKSKTTAVAVVRVGSGKNVSPVLLARGGGTGSNRSSLRRKQPLSDSHYCEKNDCDLCEEKRQDEKQRSKTRLFGYAARSDSHSGDDSASDSDEDGQEDMGEIRIRPQGSRENLPLRSGASSSNTSLVVPLPHTGLDTEALEVSLARLQVRV